MDDKEKNEDVMKFLKKNYRPPKNKKIVAKATTAIVNILQLIPAICLIIIGLFFSWCTTQMNEDGSVSAKAGEYESALNVLSNDPEAIRNAVNKVVASYQRNVSRSNDDVIVQKMVQDCTMSGVVFTHDLNTGAPYYVINYDDISGKSDTVTSGSTLNSNRLLFV